MSFHRNHLLLFNTIFFGFVFLAVLIAIGPAWWVQSKVQVLADDEKLSEQERQGLGVYVAEGCVACHTQQVRPIAMDRPWGRPSAPSDYARLGPMDVWRPYTPAVLGSARIGPDLSDVGSRQPAETWQYMHLYNPRSVVADSIMPAYPWLFELTATPGPDATVVPVPEQFSPGGDLNVVPNARGEALVAYLLSLRQPAGSHPATANSAGHVRADDKQSGLSSATRSADGGTLYAAHCAACHQANGQGLPGAFPPLAGDPVVGADDPTEHIDIVLFGAHGREIDGQTYSSPMPAFGDRFSDEEIAAMINHERTSWGNDAPIVTADDVAARRSQNKP